MPLVNRQISKSVAVMMNQMVVIIMAIIVMLLTLKVPANIILNVACLSQLLHISANVSFWANNVDPDQTAPMGQHCLSKRC